MVNIHLSFGTFCSTLDADGNGYLDFKEFILAIDLVAGMVTIKFQSELPSFEGMTLLKFRRFPCS